MLPEFAITQKEASGFNVPDGSWPMLRGAEQSPKTGIASSVNYISGMKLSAWAKANGLAYQTAWRMWRAGKPGRTRESAAEHSRGDTHRGREQPQTGPSAAIAKRAHYGSLPCGLVGLPMFSICSMRRGGQTKPGARTSIARAHAREPTGGRLRIPRRSYRALAAWTSGPQICSFGDREGGLP